MLVREGLASVSKAARVCHVEHTPAMCGDVHAGTLAGSRPRTFFSAHQCTTPVKLQLLHHLLTHSNDLLVAPA